MAEHASTPPAAAIKKFKIKKIVKHAVREYITTVDAEDAHLLRSYYWTVVSDRAAGYDYVVRAGVHGNVYLHQVIAGAKPGERVFHINGDSLDNRRANLLRHTERVEEMR